MSADRSRWNSLLQAPQAFCVAVRVSAASLAEQAAFHSTPVHTRQRLRNRLSDLRQTPACSLFCVNMVTGLVFQRGCSSHGDATCDREPMVFEWDEADPPEIAAGCRTSGTIMPQAAAGHPGANSHKKVQGGHANSSLTITFIARAPFRKFFKAFFLGAPSAVSIDKIRHRGRLRISAMPELVRSRIKHRRSSRILRYSFHSRPEHPGKFRTFLRPSQHIEGFAYCPQRNT